ncbi:MAG: hypothetical protein JSV15_01170, partial [Candidatus Bathyarchaeota archaeon]
TILIITGASGIAAFPMVTAPIVADALQAATVALQLYVLSFALGAGMAITTVFYVFQLSQKENKHPHKLSKLISLSHRTFIDEKIEGE